MAGGDYSMAMCDSGVRGVVFAVYWARVCYRSQCGSGGYREGSEVLAAVWGSCCSYLGLVDSRL